MLGIDAPVVSPQENEQEFMQRVAFSCVVPTVTHRGRFVVLAGPLAPGAMGQAHVAGVCPVLVDVPDESHARPCAEIVSGVTGHLGACARGSALILWRAGGTGVQWAVAHLGSPAPVHAFPVTLAQTGGGQGDEQYPATWTYGVADAVTGELLASDADPVAAPHRWQRPSIGWMIPATFGYAHYEDDGYSGLQLVIGWINETPDQEACDTYEGSPQE